MTKRMLIDATHAEETRVVVLDGSRLEDYDVETSIKRQLKGNIYLAKVVRVEPSLQAAFVEYGANRHGFLAFGEIHPDYYQIPVADRQRLIELQEQEAREEEERDEPPPVPTTPVVEIEAEAEAAEAPVPHPSAEPDEADPAEQPDPMPPVVAQAMPIAQEMRVAPNEAAEEFPTDTAPANAEPSFDLDLGADEAPEAVEPVAAGFLPEMAADAVPEIAAEAEPAPEMIGGEHDTSDDAARERRSARFMRHYKIQEVIRRRQILLIQVVKEERGTKGAALTTYISLAGRYSVLMPNSPRGGGVSRKITSAADRRRLKEITAELDLPRGMGMIVRTAGANRPKPEIKRDCEYLLRMWDDIREHTMRSTAPALIYEEANLIKRAIRDSYAGDVDEVMVDGEAGWQAARDFMRMMMPSHARKVQLWRDGGQPLFSRHGVEAQLDAMLQPTVQLRSGGYLVINQTEALVAIDVNSGRSTRERGIEETALRTNMEAAEEVARQLRLRDLAGLIVIDFIDMEARKHNAMVERRLKDALANDRARIQLGHISHFGLLEMSRQRLRPSISETSSVACPHCGGTGHVRSTESAALHVLRAIEDEGAKRRAAEIVLHVAGGVALYILNHKRDRLGAIETRYAMRVTFSPDDTLLPPQHRIDRVRPQLQTEAAPVMMRELPPRPVVEDADEVEDAEAETDAAQPDAAGTAEAGEDGRRRRRRRRRGGRRENGSAEAGTGAEGEAEDGAEPERAGSEEETDREPVGDAPPSAPGSSDPEQDAASPPPVAEADEGRGKRRSRRGGRRRREDAPEGTGDAMPEPQPMPTTYTGPTPADPFGGAFDIFEALEQAAEHPLAPEPSAIGQVPSLAEPEPIAEAAFDAAPEQPLPGASGATLEPIPEEPQPVEPEPASEAVPVPAASAPDPEEAAPAPTEPSSQPAIKPVLVGDAPAPEKKRGWWRR